MQDGIKVFLSGMLAGAVALTLLLSITPNLVTEAKDVIAECEKELPRDKHCKLIAKIEESP